MCRRLKCYANYFPINTSLYTPFTIHCLQLPIEDSVDAFDGQFQHL